jgi:predicted amidohydrolase YtcJ
VVEAIDAYTSGSAYVSRREHASGTIRVAAAADLAVLDADLLSIPPDRIGTVAVTRTYVGGRGVWDRTAAPAHH